VKWFNAKAGFGFVTLLGEGVGGVEVFVHHSGLRVGREQFRYLVEGEYVELEVREVEGAEGRYQVSEVRGIGGGKLMCETRSESSASGSQKRVEGRGREGVSSVEQGRKSESVVQQMRHKPKSELE